MSKVAVVTEQPKIFHLVVKRLKELGIPFYSLVPGEKIPSDVTIILTSKKEVEKVSPNANAYIIAIDFDEEDIKAAILKVKALLAECRNKVPIIVGIDPGDVYGAVVALGGKIIDASLFYSPYEVIEYINLVQKALNSFSDGTLIIRVGNGSPLHQRRLFRYFKDVSLQATYEIVDETYTTLARAKTTRRDITAAILISKKRGEVVDLDHVEISLKPGEIKYIQAKSRLMSGGKLTIDWDLAEKVARGEISLKEAVKIMEKQHEKWR
jgi:hypothetical protein